MALNKAFSAPRIYTVEAGYLARLIKDPAWEISLAPTNSPSIFVRLGAIAFILFFKYSLNDSLYSANSTIYSAKFKIYFSSVSLISVPIEISAAYFTSSSISSVRTPDKSVLEVLCLIPISLTTLEYIKLSYIIFESSGKCHPYHSLSLII